MRTVMHIVGNRPQFIKLAPLSRELRKQGYNEIIIHTGQHYDENMSDVFFEELEIPRPDENLHICGGSHARMTGDMIKALEEVALRYKPDLVFVYGDTNSTLAAAVAVRKLGIKVAHIEAGVRTRVDDNPEEINRKAVDHIADYLFAPDKAALNNLREEGLTDRSFFSGDVMYDAFKYYMNKELDGDVIDGLPDEFVLLTWHHQENTDNAERMREILELINRVPYKVVCPLHPRTKKMLKEFGLFDQALAIKNLVFCDPLGYLEIIHLLGRAKWVMTDSGGLSKESYYAGKRCIYLFDFVVWSDLERDGWIIHIKDNEYDVLSEIEKPVKNTGNNGNYYGNGDSAEVIVNTLNKAHKWESEI